MSGSRSWPAASASCSSPDQDLLATATAAPSASPSSRNWGRSTQSIHNSLRRIRQALLECLPGGRLPAGGPGMNGGDASSDSLSNLIEASCDGVIDDEGFHQLEAMLLASAEAGRRLAGSALHGHAELHFAMRAPAVGRRCHRTRPRPRSR